MDKKNLLKTALHMLIQDLAEAWLKRATEPRKLETLDFGLCNDMLPRIYEKTGKTITSKTLLKYIDDDISTKTYHYNLLAACWFIENGILSISDVNHFKGGVEITKASSFWNDYLNHIFEKEKIVTDIIGKQLPEGETLEYKDHVPQKIYLAKLISAFANTKGGNIILGIDEANGIEYSDKNLKPDDLARTYTKDAIDLLSQKPNVKYGWVYVQHKNMMLYLVEIDKSSFKEPIALDGTSYVRQGEDIIPIISKDNAKSITPSSSFEEVTEPLFELRNRFKSTVSIIHRVTKLYNYERGSTPVNTEGKLLLSLLFSSSVGTFINYLDDTLQKIYFKKKSSVSKMNASKLARQFSHKIIDSFRKGDVNRFLIGIKKIDKKFNAILHEHENDLKRIIQLDLIFSQRNGVIDSDFFKQFSNEKLATNSEYPIFPNEITEVISLLTALAEKIDFEANKEFKLAHLKVLKK